MNMNDKRKTVGQISSELIVNGMDNTHSAEEQMREQLNDYELNINESIRKGKSEYTSDFFVVVLTKKERLMKNVLRNYFITRITCPTPEYDQAVYRYDRKKESVDFLWVVPSKHTCEMYKKYTLEVPKEEYELLRFVLDFEDGTLFKQALLFNKEI